MEIGHPGFVTADCLGCPTWKHKTAPVWVVCYPGIENSRTHRYDMWQAYKATEGFLGREPWTVMNKRLGPELGWPTSDQAFEAACFAAQDRAVDKEKR